MVPALAEYSPIGLCFDGRSVRAAQTRRTRRGDCLAAAALLPRICPESPIHPEEALAIRSALARMGFRGRKIVLAVPEDKLLVSMLELPLRGSGAPLEQIARAELARIHGYEPDTAEMVCWDLPPTPAVKSATYMMALAYRHSDAEELLVVFEQAGFQPEAMESRLAAIARASESLRPNGVVTAVLETGWGAGILGFLWQNKIVYQRLLPEAALQSLATRLTAILGPDVDPLEVLFSRCMGQGRDGNELAELTAAIQDEVSTYLQKVCADLAAPVSYIRQQYPSVLLNGLLLTGAAARIPGAAERCRENLNCPVTSVAPINLLNATPATMAVAEDSSLVVPLGLAQYRPEGVAE